MRLSCRYCLVDKIGGVLRLKSSMFDRLVRDPFHHAMPGVAGQLARLADVTVELRDRVPVRVVRRVYVVLAFDDQGHCDVDRFRKQHWSLAASVLDPVPAPPEAADEIRDAADRFIARGGRWRPTAELARLIDCAALGVPAWRRSGYAEFRETNAILACLVQTH